MSDPGPSALLDAPGERLAELSARMRALGARVGVGELITAERALAALADPCREDARLTLRAVLCAQRADLDRFEAAFAAVFGAGGDAEPLLDALGGVVKEVLPRAGMPAPGVAGAPGAAEPVPAAYSDRELLGAKDFSQYSDGEVMLARPLIVALARRAPRRRSRRLAPSRRRGAVPDLAATVRASLRTGGEPLLQCWRAPTLRPRPVVLVLDLSGSMTPYARMLLHYAHACVEAHRRVEVFAFGTQLTRITAELAERDPVRALARASASAPDFGGGTRIGEALGELNRRHGRRVGRGAAVIILSDGWDRGEPERLGAEIARLRRSAHRLIWLNPLAADPRFAPLARGMAAAMPHVDTLLAGHSLDSLRRLADTLEAL
ncbi:VWA domain-containing protein [Conexibacter sp. DBS9H8]|uniref:vWA domain-containing protein n=1 Tax=Conexibacter sp. DBS9H8 TaxID=2937801 RepID=UPI00200E2A60|nr:VWA domain-containing protein [Conexibacter sp. DBS9H8]